ncbi:hypothetical protein [Nitrosomonas sp.]|uniref:hypothetical protein n=1 Tax=Nitrosomonas sp. TaxID=42353 RepID=UPI0025D2C1A8|nr:hypothetical protein [Nitrosomonas sp.]MBY0484594.1 hypothetical protein [Nitrosomonas sp.]
MNKSLKVVDDNGYNFEAYIAEKEAATRKPISKKIRFNIFNFVEFVGGSQGN